MKRLRSSNDLDSFNEKNGGKESVNHNRSSSSHRSLYHKSSSDNNFVRKGLISSSTSSSSRYDRERQSLLSEDDGSNRESSRVPLRKRSDHDFDGFERRKGFDHRHREDRVHRSESFCVTRKEFPKGFRSERERPRREGSVSSWRRFNTLGKDFVSEERERSSVRSRERELKDVKSPSWSKDSGSEQSRVRGGMGMDSRDSRSKSKSKSRSSRSPTWSRDSGSEQSRSVGKVGKKNEDETQVQSGSSSEMEEGELEPEPHAEPASCPQVGIQNEEKEENVPVDANSREDKTNNTSRNIEMRTEFGIAQMETESDRREVDSEHRDEVRKEAEKEGSNGELNIKKLEVQDADELQVDGTKLHGNPLAGDSGNGIKDKGADQGEENQGGENENSDCKEEEKMDAVSEKALHSPEEHILEKGIDLVVKGEECAAPNANKEIKEENGQAEVNMDANEGFSQSFRDKGKRVAVIPIHVSDSPENCAWTERGTINLLTGRDEDEGPSIRGFELFSSSPVRRPEKAGKSGLNKKEDENMGLELLDLSLSLPNVLLPIGAQDANPAPGSPSHARSVQSLTNTFCTNSDGFTASVSFSGSQSFYHNPSCSLTQNSQDFEQSVHSRPIFQGLDQASQGAWQTQSQNESRHKEVPLYQRILMNGNVSVTQSQTLQGTGQGQRVTEGSSKIQNGFDRQLSFHKHNDVRSPAQSVGSHEIGSSYSFEKKKTTREKHDGSLHRSNSQKEKDQLLIGGTNFVETIVARIVSDPMHVMAKKFHEMTGLSIVRLKESIVEIMRSTEKLGQLYTCQNALQNRSDITLEMLLKSHRSQLEILVALRTGLPEFLLLDNSVSSSDLAEIFLNLRCRNLTCRSALPVDECECKICKNKDGFCSSCMCLICSKFDMASNTCSWVGCDVCLHWCHADCGLQESYIRNGCSATGAQGTTEMQFHCVACDHPSEMFGFVKEVFQNFAKDWSREAFSKELEYVRRIFSASKDLRGKRLHEITNQMMVRLTNKSELTEVFNYIMGFLTDCESSKFSNTAVSPEKELGKSNGIPGPSQDASWLKSGYSDNPARLERSSSLLLPSFPNGRTDKHPVQPEFQRNARKEHVFDELESIVRIKQAEGKMFQERADDARREAEGLKRIAIAKNEKIEEEYMSRIAKLQLAEAEEMRKQKYEELQALERAHREYFNMKMRMEEDIKDLLLKMEATKRNLAL